MYEDQPQELVHDLIAEAVFGHHPLGRPVIGTAEVISSVSRRAITAYHRSMYVPGNIVVAAAAPDHNELLGLLEQAESKVGEPLPGRRVRSPLVKPPPPDLRFMRKDTEQYHPVRGAGHREADRRRFAASLLERILGSASSRLFQEIRESGGWSVAQARSRRNTPTPARSGCTSARGRRISGLALEIAAEQIEEIASGNLRPNG